MAGEEEAVRDAVHPAKLERIAIGVLLFAIQVVAYASAVDHLGHIEPRRDIASVALVLSLGAGAAFFLPVAFALRHRRLDWRPLATGVTYALPLGVYLHSPLHLAYVMDSSLPLDWMIYGIGGMVLLVPLGLGLGIWMFRARLKDGGQATVVACALAIPLALVVQHLILATHLLVFWSGQAQEASAMYQESPSPGLLLLVACLTFLAWSRSRQ